jgi:hypothetical protein
MNRVDEQQLTAYVLDELPHDERARFEAELLDNELLRAAVTDLQREVREIRSAAIKEPCPRFTETQRELITQQITEVVSSGGRAVGWTIFNGGSVTWLTVAAIMLVAVGSVAGIRQLWRANEPPSPTRETHEKTDDPFADTIETELPTIRLRVGETMPLRIVATGADGQQWTISPTAVDWENSAAKGHVAVNIEAGEIKGEKTTSEPVLLRVRQGDIRAGVLIEVLPWQSQPAASARE